MAWFYLNLTQYWIPTVSSGPGLPRILGIPQSLNSLRENGLYATCNIGEIIEQILQADKKISGSAHIKIRINKHYSDIMQDVPHPFG
jgi:hypothetical protein